MILRRLKCLLGRHFPVLLEADDGHLEITELDYVELRRAVEGHPAGTRGTVVSVHPAHDAYTVEVTDGGKTVDLLDCESLDLVLLSEARSTSHYRFCLWCGRGD